VRRPFYGWIMVGTLFFLEFVNMGFPFYGGGVINSYMLKRVAMDRSVYGLGFTLCNLFVGISSAFVAVSILRFGLRITFAIGSLLTIIGALWMAFYVVHAWQYLIGFGVLIGSGIGFGTIVPISTGVTRWFKRSRGKAMAVVFSASGWAGFGCVPFFNRILSTNGADFRAAWIIIAAAAGFGGAVAWFFVRESPASMGQTPDGLAVDGADEQIDRASLTVKTDGIVASAYRSVSFWMIMLGAIACQFPFFFFNAHALLHMRDNGVNARDAAWALGTFTAVSIIGRFIGGWLIDQIDVRAVFILGLLGYMAGSMLAIPIHGSHLWLSFAAASCYGWAFGCSWISLQTITGIFYGVAAYPRLSGTIMIVSGIVCAPAGIIGGKLFDLYGSYAAAFRLNAVIALIGMITLLFARKPSTRADGDCLPSLRRLKYD